MSTASSHSSPILFSRTFLALLAVLLFQLSCAGKIVQQHALTIETQSNGPVVFHVELAVYPDEQERGLMHRTSMPEDAGMLFVFGTVEHRAFWMKNTLIPLDMIFISEDGTINHIHHSAKPLDLSKVTSEYPVKAVLEINGGVADKMGLAEGDKIIHPVFRNQLDPQ